MRLEKILSKITAVNGNEYYLLTSLHDGGERGMDLAMVRENHAWTGEVSEDDLKGSSQDLKMDYKEYIAQTRKCLTRQNVGGLDFQYTCKERPDRLNFIWKKHVSTDDIKIQLGSTVLHKSEEAGDIITNIFEHALEATTRLQSTITSLEADNERLMTERATALKRLEKCVANKDKMEEDMYSKFAVVINEKKAKIRSLQEQSAGSGDSLEGRDNTNVRQESNDETDDMSDAGSGSDTDDGRSTPPMKRSRPLKSEPSTDDNLVLGDSSATSTPVLPRRRRRAGSTNKKATPSRPVLPKASSKEATPGTSGGRRASLRKGASNISSNASSDNIDNLFDDF